ncbi:Hypothetical predicted protein [Paramuricea clavata]|uniref:Uncharacterized protein n=1 Tax=Paramuricea clavata TaxID=317549 RepID=A0A6S7H5C1_PARCT|nr:Hypothetical predicted protein [Paramuricea clavata]
MLKEKNKSAISYYRYIYNSWTFEDVKDQKDPAKILDRFMEHLEQRTNHQIHRLKISQPNASLIGNEEMEDRLLDQLRWGTNDPEVQKSLIGRDEKLTLNTAIDIARSYEATKHQMHSLSNQNKGNPQQIDNITHKKLNADNKNQYYYSV